MIATQFDLTGPQHPGRWMVYERNPESLLRHEEAF